MRTFIRYDAQGRIMSVLKAVIMPGTAEHPFQLTDEGEGVIELEPDDPLAALDSLEIQEGYAVDLKKQQLVKQQPRAASKSRKRKGTK